MHNYPHSFVIRGQSYPYFRYFKPRHQQIHVLLPPNDICHIKT